MIFQQKKLVISVFIVFLGMFFVPLITSRANMFVITDTTPTDVIITFPEGINAADFRANYPGVDIRHTYKSINSVAATIPSQLLTELENSPLVKLIELDQKVSISMLDPGDPGGPGDTLDWGVDKINAELVWGSEEDATNVYPLDANAGQGVKVCVLDTGIEYNHPDLYRNYKGGYDFVNNDDDPMDDYGHGTHCAGIIAARDNGVGVVGVAPRADLYAVKVLNEYGSGTYSDVIAGVEWAIANDMDIISMSLGGSSGTAALSTAMQNAYNAGIVLVAATGNDYASSISYPARYSTVIAVGATDSSDNRASFSNYGSGLELMAPGVNIYSSVPFALEGTLWDTKSGTSMACPMVAGAAALILNEYPTLPPAEVRLRLRATTLDRGATGWDTYYGYGRLRADAAVFDAQDTTLPSVSLTSPTTTIVKGTIPVTATASDNQRIDKVQFYVGSTLKYTDYNPSYSWTWDTTTASEGYHTIYCKAWDNWNNLRQTSKTVYVDNIADGGGGGCPILSVYDGTDYVSEGLLDIHHESEDVLLGHILQTPPQIVHHHILLRLTEHPLTISHIDQVQLYATLKNGQMIRLPLLSAIHSEEGNVLFPLLRSDDYRVDVYGEIWNDGVSQSIDLTFLAFPHPGAVVSYTFIIEGVNYIVK